MSRHIGSDFDGFLEEEKLRDPTEALAARRVIAYRIRQLMRQQGLDAGQLAERLDLEVAGIQQVLGADAETVDLLFLARVAERLSEWPGEEGAQALQGLVDRLKEIYLRS